MSGVPKIIQKNFLVSHCIVCMCQMPPPPRPTMPLSKVTPVLLHLEWRHSNTGDVLLARSPDEVRGKKPKKIKIKQMLPPHPIIVSCNILHYLYLGFINALSNG